MYWIESNPILYQMKMMSQSETDWVSDWPTQWQTAVIARSYYSQLKRWTLAKANVCRYKNSNLYKKRESIFYHKLTLPYLTSMIPFSFISYFWHIYCRLPLINSLWPCNNPTNYSQSSTVFGKVISWSQVPYQGWWLVPSYLLQSPNWEEACLPLLTYWNFSEL